MSDPDEQGVNLLEVALDSPVLENVTISVLESTGQTVTVKYKTLPDNHPLSNGNKLWLWEGTVIDWAHPDRGVNEPVRSEDSEGWFTMEVELSRKNYTVGYSVTGGVMGICASALINPPPELALLLAPISVTLSIYSLTATQLVISYSTLRGYQPLRAGNWLGLWRGDVLPSDAPPPIEVTLPEDDANQGLATFNTALRPQTTYTVIYFMADQKKQAENTSAAALLRFDTS
jgi:hypothetical protein